MIWIWLLVKISAMIVILVGFSNKDTDLFFSGVFIYALTIAWGFIISFKNKNKGDK